MIYDDDFCVRLVALPLTIRAQTVVDGDGFYNIYINSLLSYPSQLSAFWHEMRHIQRGDFWSAANIRTIEAS